ncbi:MAG: hypothetical protein H7066_16265 [Cytophagaceae bacterium]|nr:hypothetical protein [Gemmatimonadaceae bacterium]
MGVNVKSWSMRSAQWARRLGVVALASVAACGSDGVAGPDPTPPTPGVALTVPTALGVIQGGTTILTVGIARTSYVGVVFMTLSGLPAGVTGPSVTSTSTNQFQVTLVATPTATTGAATVTVHASGIDIPNAQGTFVLNVAPR